MTFKLSLKLLSTVKANAKPQNQFSHRRSIKLLFWCKVLINLSENANGFRWKSEASCNSKSRSFRFQFFGNENRCLWKETARFKPVKFAYSTRSWDWWEIVRTLHCATGELETLGRKFSNDCHMLWSFYCLLHNFICMQLIFLFQSSICFNGFNWIYAFKWN